MTFKAIFHGTKRFDFAPLACAVLAFSFFAFPARVCAQASPQIVGTIDGGEYSVEAGPGNSAAAIQAATHQLVSGAHVTVRSGQSRVILDAGGGIAICGPARFQLLVSGDTLTVVVEYGELDLHLDSTRTVSVFTPLIVATPISVGGGPRETIVGLARSGDMCLRATHGAARIEQQLSGQSLLVPQFGEVSLSGGQVLALKSPEGACACSVEEARLVKPEVPPVRATLSASAAPASPVTHETIGVVATPETKRLAAPPQAAPRPAEQTSPQFAVDAPSGPPMASQEIPPPPQQATTAGPPVQRAIPPGDSTLAEQGLPDSGEPIYKVLVPALTFDATSPAPPPNPSPDTIVLVRSVRVQPDTIYTDKVESKSGVKPASKSASGQTKGESKQPSRGFFASVGRFFHRIFG